LKNRNKIAAVIPAYNEEKSIAGVVEEIRALKVTAGLDVDAVVVNDCSKDRTAEVASGTGCVLLNLPVNLGIGGAVQTGFKYALINGYEYAVQVDGDGQHPPAEIAKLFKAMQDGGLDVVIGSRFISKQGFQSTFMRRIGITYFMFLNKLLTGQRITDSTSGLRLLNRKALEIAGNYYPDEYPEPESLVLYAFNKLKIGEVAVEMRERQGGVSSIGTFASFYYLFKVSLAMFFTYLRTRRR
jgi:glycosyltransferase involved in cell wall biosynthesis